MESFFYLIHRYIGMRLWCHLQFHSHTMYSLDKHWQRDDTGIEVINKFLAEHKCNKYCERLQLEGKSPESVPPLSHSMSPAQPLSPALIHAAIPAHASTELLPPFPTGLRTVSTKPVLPPIISLFQTLSCSSSAPLHRNGPLRTGE